MNFHGITLTVNYPETSVEAAIPAEGSLEDIVGWLKRLCSTEPEMTSIVLVAVKKTH